MSLRSSRSRRVPLRPAGPGRPAVAARALAAPAAGASSTRAAIVEAADDLFYRRGFEHTSFADIAGAVRISRGNFYHHFKSKDEILSAVIERRLARTQQMLDGWEAAAGHPAERIRSFIRILITNQANICRHGCPVGTLCGELAKLNHAARAEANGLFELFRRWLREQFTGLGCEADADRLAMHLLARSQGVATLANALGDTAFIEREVEDLCEWLEACTERRTPGARAAEGRRARAGARARARGGADEGRHGPSARAKVR